MKEEITLTYAKQYFKRNIGKYGVKDSFIATTCKYSLRDDEIQKLKNYGLKLYKGVYSNEIKIAVEHIIYDRIHNFLNY